MNIRKPSGNALFAWSVAYVLALVWLFSTVSQFIYLAPLPWQLDVLLFALAAVYTTVAALLESRPNIAPTLLTTGYCLWAIHFFAHLAGGLNAEMAALAFLLFVAAACGSFSVSWSYAGIIKRLRSLPPLKD